MFEKIKSWGDHQILKYNKNDFQFLEYFQDLFNENNLEYLHLKSKDYNEVKDVLNLGYLNDRDTDLHKIFYDNIKNNLKFKKLYCRFIKNIYDNFFPNEDCLIYQSFPSIRIQYMESVVIPPHCDSDKLSNHPLGEKNFIIPITKMYNTNSIYIESEPGKEDFESVSLEYGNLFYFNGNKCIHFNKKNQEDKLRISLDFRIILKKDYIKYLEKNNIISSNPRDIFWNRKPKLMQIGGYYQIHFKKDTFDSMLSWTSTDKFIMQHRPTFEKEEAEACYKYMLEDNFVTEHKKTIELENIISDYLGTKYCIMTTSGTIAIVMALMSLDLNPGDEVIVPNYTMIATINAIKFLNLKPVIIDINENTFTLDYDGINKNINNKTKCVIHVSLNNRYCNLDDIVKLCNDKNITLIEDSAQSLGCKFNNKSLGTFGKLGCFSLSTPKIISTGQGGFIVTNDDELNKKIRMIKNFGREKSGVDNFLVFGLNFKFTDIQAVIGIEQMKKLDYRVKRMREIYDLYYENLKDHYKILKPLNKEWIPWFVDIYVDNREYLIKLLKSHNIQTRPVYGEINKTNIYYSENNLKNSFYVCNKGLFLPSYITLTNKEIIHICNILKMVSIK